MEVLSDARDPSRKTLLAGVIVGCDERDLGSLVSLCSDRTLTDLDLGVMRDSRLSVLRGQCNFEHSEVVLLHLMRVSVPVV